MVKCSTLYYLVDDYNLPSEMILKSLIETKLPEEYFSHFLEILEIDPGSDLVSRTLERINS